MQPHQHGYIFRESDIGRVMSQFGNKPGKKVSQKLDSRLRQEKDRFIEIQRQRENRLDRSNQRGRKA